MARKDKLKLRQQAILAANKAASQKDMVHGVQLQPSTSRKNISVSADSNTSGRAPVDHYWYNLPNVANRKDIKVICIPADALGNVPDDIPVISLVGANTSRFDKVLTLRYKHDGVCYMPSPTDIKSIYDFLAECIIAKAPVIAIHCTEGSIRSFNTAYGICYALPDVFSPDFSYPDTNPHRYEERRLIRAISNGLEAISERLKELNTLSNGITTESL